MNWDEDEADLATTLAAMLSPGAFDIPDQTILQLNLAYAAIRAVGELKEIPEASRWLTDEELARIVETQDWRMFYNVLKDVEREAYIKTIPNGTSENPAAPQLETHWRFRLRNDAIPKYLEVPYIRSMPTLTLAPTDGPPIIDGRTGKHVQLGEKLLDSDGNGFRLILVGPEVNFFPDGSKNAKRAVVCVLETDSGRRIVSTATINVVGTERKAFLVAQFPRPPKTRLG